MSDQVVDVQGLVKNQIMRMPDLAPYESHLRLVVGFYAECVLASPPMSVADAETFLGSFLNLDKRGLLQLVNSIDQAGNKQLVALVADIQERTGVAIDLKQGGAAVEKRARAVDLINQAIEKRRDEELEEQRAKTTEAKTLLANAALAMQHLGLRDLWSEQNVRPTGIEKPMKWSLKGAIQGKMLEKGLLEIPEQESDDERPVGDWLTEPIMRSDDQALQDATSRINWLVARINELLADEKTKNSVAETLMRRLGNLGVTKEQLESQILSVSEIAHDQIDLSASSIAAVGVDMNRFKESLGQVDDLQDILFAVVRFFFPQPA
ncbi:hypothetical protein A2154_03950 [Candidatus Gottesmanbacteria bacterium RBG_16_43_7]|uniref:Uncharacterized protein n=1 Tax=Candidatus Gottesmanbacteria bacterium RBG_16_43_7 TaxID=1798373 RepID=A0A1F5Z8N6_9BACT|nr:MAG: hypothetical protein A2154_03950 [Candidatus Gottesmanbacteria bacterium RBG_16_43_7]